MVRQAEAEMTVIKEKFYTYKSLETTGPACYVGPCREAPTIGQEADGVGAHCGQSLYCGFYMKDEGGKAGRQVQDGLV